MGDPADPDLDRYRSQAIRTASQRSLPTVASQGAILPTHHSNSTTTPTSAKKSKLSEAGGLSTIHGRDEPSSGPEEEGAGAAIQDDYFGRDGARGHNNGRDPEKATHNDNADAISHAAPPPAPPPPTEDEGPGDSTLNKTEEDGKKPPITTRMKNGCKRFGKHFKNAIFHSWVNVLLVAVPAGIAVEAAGLDLAVIFAVNAIAIVPLAGLLSHATESVASRLGDTLGALLNVSFGNAVELIIFIIALVKNEIRIVQASLLGSILANLLLILGMAFLFGGLRFREQVYNSTVTQMSACLLSLSVMSLLLPTAFHASFNLSTSSELADSAVLKVSRGTSVILLIVYGLYLLFQLKSHAYMYESTPQEIIDEESHPGVLADIMNSSSSSSDDSSSSDSSDSDTSNSGSVATTTRKVKRMFKHRMRRKSSASTGSSKPASKVPSVLSSPSTQERQDPIEQHNASRPTSRRESNMPAVASVEDADADMEDNGTSRRFDWATGRHMSNDGSKSPDPPKRHKKHSKKKEKKRRRREQEKQDEVAIAENEKPNGQVDGPKVEFADDVQVVSEQPAATQTPKLGFNMRQLSSRVRPALPSMLSNNVFVQPLPTPTPAPRPAPVQRSKSENNLRRTSSLPDRLNRQGTPASNVITQTRSGPLPPYQHQRFPLRKQQSDVPSAADEAEGEVEDENMSRTAAVVLLLFSTALVAVCAEFMVDAIPEMIESSGNISEAFIGLIILPIVGNAAEHVTAVTVAAKNKMDLAIGVAVGSSIQIALFVTPIVVLLGWILKTEMSLYFNLFETISLFVTAFVVNFLVLDGRSNYLEGSLLIASYVIIAIIAFFYPDTANQSDLGGSITPDRMVRF